MKIYFFFTIIFIFFFITCSPKHTANHVYPKKGEQSKVNQHKKDRKVHEKLAKKRREEINNLHPNTINKKKKTEINTY